MGIPFYYSNLIKQYPRISRNNLTNISVETLYLDYNGIIHPVLHKYLADVTKMVEVDFFDFLWKYTLEIVKSISPKNVIICVDGVAPLAKIIQQRKRRYVSSLEKKMVVSIFDTNNITCGTPFMERLCDYIQDKCSKNSSVINFTFDRENGEGEHKIFDYIHNKPDEIVVIHGLDADLILLSLMSVCNRIYLARENYNRTTFIDIRYLREIIIQDFQNIRSYVVLYTLLGNDFIPHPITINLGVSSAMNRLKQLHDKHGLLVDHDGNIDHGNLTSILLELAITEDDDIMNLFNCNDDQDAILLKKSTNWRKTYYNDIIFAKDPQMISVKFLEGIYWTYNYYNKKKPVINHSWFYPYYGPPTMRDLANICMTAKNFTPVINANDPVLSYIPKEIKLLIAIPKTSKDVLPEKLQSYMIDHSLGLTYMYPDSFRMIKLFKKHDWEHIPILPLIDIKYIKRLLRDC
tara:strand:+ start:3313 stop:4698 length:1386 start_codon:yes stop_codon:yes gene_type:complete